MTTPSPRGAPDSCAARLVGGRGARMGPPADLFILQASFDDEAAHRAAADLRAQIREDLRWGPPAAVLLFILTAALAALSRGLPA